LEEEGFLKLVAHIEKLADEAMHNAQAMEKCDAPKASQFYSGKYEAYQHVLELLKGGEKEHITSYSR